MPRKPGDRKESEALAALLGQKVRALRLGRGWTQNSLSERIGISVEALGRIERGRSLPSFPTLLKLCRHLGTSPDDLLGYGEAEPGERGLRIAEEHARYERGDVAATIETLTPKQAQAIHGLLEVIKRFVD